MHRRITSNVSIVLFCLLVCVLVPAQALAGEASGSTGSTGSTTGSDSVAGLLLAPVVVTASRIEQPSSQVGSSVFVLSADELMEQGVEFVADALKEVPSLSVTSQGPRGSKTQIRVRGNEANHVLVLIDGIRVSDASTGEYDLANLMLDSVERIEVVLGPQSTLYGSDAIGGVIQIITRKGGNGLGGRVQLSAGSFGTESGFAQVVAGSNGWHYAMTVNRFRTEGISAASKKYGNTEKDGFDLDAVSVKAGYDHETFNTWMVYLKNKSRNEYDASDYATGFAIDNSDNEQTIDTDALSWVLAVPLLNKRWNNQIQLATNSYDYDSYSNDSFGAFHYITLSDRDSVDYQSDFRLTADQTIQFGLNSVKDALQVNGYSTFDKDVKQRGLYLQWLGKVGSMDMSIGTRRDDHDEFGGYNTYRFTTINDVGAGWKFRTAYGTGFKAPSLQELYDPSYGGNADLQPEESTSFEVGFDYKTKTYNASLTAFQQDTDNLIRAKGVYPNTKFENVDSASSKGLELSMKALHNGMETETVITRMNATETVDGVTKSRLRVPKVSGTIKSSYKMPGGIVWAKVEYVGERRDLKFANFTSQDVTLEDYWLLHMGAGINIASDLTLSMRFENLLDEEYEEIYSYGTRGRSAYVTFDWKL